MASSRSRGWARRDGSRGDCVKLLVTGGAGFIGSNFIRYWLRHHQNDHISNLDLLTYAGDRKSLMDVERDQPTRYEFIHGDIADVRVVGELLSRAGIDAIVNFAAESHNSRAVSDPARFVRTNVVGTQTLLDAAIRRQVRFHHISTCEVYGDLPLDSANRFTEESPYRPHTPYNASKAAADHMVRAYHETFGLPTTISNSSNNYGPFQHPEKVIPVFVTSALDRRPLPVYRSSQHRREWLHVEDHCRAIETILERGRVGETYNVGSGVERTLDELADRILDIVGAPRTLKTYVADRPGHDRRYLLDHSKIERNLDWQPRIDFDAGLEATVRWYEANTEWWRPKAERSRADIDESRWAGSLRT